MENQFHFVQLTKCHHDDIRSMVIFNDVGISNKQKLLTISRDSEAHVYGLNEKNGVFNSNVEFTFYLPTQISTACVLSESFEEYPLSVFVFGCLNGHIYIFHGYEQNAAQCLTNHTKNVCVVRSNSNMSWVASGSWDHSALLYKMEKSFDEKQNLKLKGKILGHTESVMDLAFINDNRLLTASSDRSIVLWNIDPSLFEEGRQAIQLKNFLGHDDCVRGLLLKSNNQFYSISNDQTIRFWDLESGSASKTYLGHSHFIFDICQLSDNDFVTSGEQNSVIIWNHNRTAPWQSFQLPAVTVWCVLAPNPNVFYAAGSDGVLYVYSNQPDLIATPEQQSIFDEMIVKQTKVLFSTVAHLKLYEENSLQKIPAKTDGEQRLIRSMEDETILVYQWSDNQKKWKPIGHVPDYNHSDADQSTGRVQYNDEFYDEVFNVKLNNKTYKLPFNRDQNPWQVSQMFIESNQLDYETIDSLVQCIVKYASYKPKTSHSEDIGGHFPIFEFRLYNQLPDLGKLCSKFETFNDQMPENLRLESFHLELTANEIKNPEPYCTQIVDAYEKLFKWQDNKFIVYDLLRILLCNKFFNTFFLNRLELSGLFGVDSIFGSIIGGLTESNDLALQLTSLRVLVNLFASVHGAEFMYKNFTFVHRNLLKWSQLMKNLNIHLAYSSVWFNYSVMLTDFKKKQSLSFQHNLMSKIIEHDCEMIASNQIESIDGYEKVVLEVLNTFGNLLSSSYFSENSERYRKLLQQSYLVKFKQNNDIRYVIRQIDFLQST